MPYHLRVDHPPPCCASCPELPADTRRCRLLAKPTAANRRRMATMPCDARRLVKQRMRAHGEDTMNRAMAAWDGDGVFAPPHELDVVDARLFMSPWPFLELVPSEEEPPRSGRPLVPPQSKTLNALVQLLEIDELGFVFVVSALRGPLDLGFFRAALGQGELEITERYLLGLFKMLALASNAPLAVESETLRQCVIARYFQPGWETEIGALHAAQEALPEATLNIVTFREAVRSGLLAVLEILAKDPTISVVLDEVIRSGFASALRLEAHPPEGIPLGAESAILILLARELELGDVPNTLGHVPARTLANAVVPSPEERQRLVAHLLACSDQRCLVSLRGEVCGRETVRRSLAQAMSEPPPPPHGVQGTPRMIHCKDVLWQAFASMAQAEGREVNDLVEEAMDRYRLLRQRLRAQSGIEEGPGSVEPSKRPSVQPPGSSRSGLRLPARPTSRPPPPPGRTDPSPTASPESSPEDEEPTRPALDKLGDDEQTRPR